MKNDFLEEIVAFCRQAGITKTRFGKLALGSPAFVQRLAQGVRPRRATVDYVRRFMAKNRTKDLRVSRGRAPKK